MSTLSFRSMTKEEFEIYFARLQKQLFSDAMRTNIATEAEVNRWLEIDFLEINRDRFETKNNYWLMLLKDDTESIGSLWYSFRGEGDNKTPYLADLYVVPEFRGQGIAKKALALFEAELKSQGIKNNIAVHIVGDFNEAAIRLFKSSGYFASAVLMEKRLTPLA